MNKYGFLVLWTELNKPELAGIARMVGECRICIGKFQHCRVMLRGNSDKNFLIDGHREDSVAAVVDVFSYQVDSAVMFIDKINADSHKLSKYSNCQYNHRPGTRTINWGGIPYRDSKSQVSNLTLAAVTSSKLSVVVIGMWSITACVCKLTLVTFIIIIHFLNLILSPEISTNNTRKNRKVRT